MGLESLTAFFQYGFMRNAFLAVLIITPLFGLLGTMIVQKKMAFFSDALGHSALTGIALGVVFGIGDTSLSMIVFAVAFALLLNFIGERVAAFDTVISVFSSCSVALGLAILSAGGNFSKYSSLLVGDILMENLFAVVMALIVMLSIKWVGILIINALLILPAAASRNISENMREYHFFSLVFSLFSGILGLFISYYTNVATGPMIVIIASVLYFSTYVYAGKRNV